MCSNFQSARDAGGIPCCPPSCAVLRLICRFRGVSATSSLVSRGRGGERRQGFLRVMSTAHSFAEADPDEFCGGGLRVKEQMDGRAAAGQHQL